MHDTLRHTAMPEMSDVKLGGAVGACLLCNYGSCCCLRVAAGQGPPHKYMQVHCSYDVVVALDNDIKSDIIKMVQPEWHSYYDAKVCLLDQFSDYLGTDILKTGGTAVLESELSGIIRPVMQERQTIPNLLRPSLHKGRALLAMSCPHKTVHPTTWSTPVLHVAQSLDVQCKQCGRLPAAFIGRSVSASVSAQVHHIQEHCVSLCVQP